MSFPPPPRPRRAPGTVMDEERNVAPGRAPPRIIVRGPTRPVQPKQETRAVRVTVRSAYSTSATERQVNVCRVAVVQHQTKSHQAPNSNSNSNNKASTAHNNKPPASNKRKAGMKRGALMQALRSSNATVGACAPQEVPVAKCAPEPAVVKSSPEPAVAVPVFPVAPSQPEGVESKLGDWLHAKRAQGDEWAVSMAASFLSKRESVASLRRQRKQRLEEHEQWVVKMARLEHNPHASL